MLTTGNEIVDAIGQVHFEGNVVPHKWFELIHFDNGKPDLVAITVLSEILYWYRPSYEKDEVTGRLLRIKKRFKSDLLQRSYESFADQFGITKRQAKDAIYRLEVSGYIKRHFRTIDTNNTKLGNVLFIELLHQNVIALTFESQRCDVETSEVLRSDDIPLTTERQTNTDITTETTTNNNVELSLNIEIVNYLNQKANKNFKPNSAATKKLINARLNDGYTIEQFKQVIDLKAKQWLNNPDMQNYLRPSTLFNATNFENYCNEMPVSKSKINQPQVSTLQRPQLNLGVDDE